MQQTNTNLVKTLKNYLATTPEADPRRETVEAEIIRVAKTHLDADAQNVLFAYEVLAGRAAAVRVSLELLTEVGA